MPSPRQTGGMLKRRQPRTQCFQGLLRALTVYLKSAFIFVAKTHDLVLVNVIALGKAKMHLPKRQYSLPKVLRQNREEDDAHLRARASITDRKSDGAGQYISDGLTYSESPTLSWPLLRHTYSWRWSHYSE